MRILILTVLAALVVLVGAVPAARAFLHGSGPVGITSGACAMSNANGCSFLSLTGL